VLVLDGSCLVEHRQEARSFELRFQRTDLGAVEMASNPKLTGSSTHPKVASPLQWSSFVKIAGAVGASLLFSGLSGCQRPSHQPVTVTVLDPEWSQPDELPASERESQEFTRETGILVKHLPVPETSLSQLGLWRKLLQEGGPTPDVLAIDVIWPGILSEYLMDLKPYAATELSSGDPELVASYTVGGKVVALPYHPQIGVLAYRVDLLREYGYERPPKTWDELEKMAARIQAGERAKGKKDFWGYLWQGGPAEGLACNALEWQMAEGGGRVIENDKTISVNNPAAIRSWQRAAHWIGWISPTSIVAYRELDSMNVWNSGGAAFRRSWQSDFRLSHWQNSSLGAVTGYTSLPGGPGGRASTLGGTGLGVSRSSAHPLEAITFIRSLVRRDIQSRQQRANSQPPAQPQLYDLPLELQPYALPAGSGQQRGGLVARPSIVSGQAYEQVTKAFVMEVHSVLTREKTAKDAAAALEKKLMEITGFKTGPPPTAGSIAH
jgi:trehalose/maltose transport system substrate-binding protein